MVASTGTEGGTEVKPVSTVETGPATLQPLSSVPLAYTL